MENIIIIGSGCAGLTAAIYATRANLNPLVIDGPLLGGALTQTHEVDNFPGFPEGASGFDILENMRTQAKRLGAKFKSGIVKSLIKENDIFEITLNNDEKLIAKSVIIATGSSPIWLGVEGEEKFKGKGVSVCATCDGFFYKGKTVAVVGGGNSALIETKYLSSLCEKVYLIHRRDEFRGDAVLVEKLKTLPNVEFVLSSRITEIKGNEKVESIIINGEKEIKLDGIFAAIGFTPNTAFVNVDKDEKGFIKIDPVKMSASIDGIFACGDCANPYIQQAIISCGQGATAAISAEHYLNLKD